MCACVNLTFLNFAISHSVSPFTVVSAAQTCPSSCPWGLIPQHQFVLEEDRGLAFIRLFSASESSFSDRLSVWHLTPLLHDVVCESSETMFPLCWSHNSAITSPRQEVHSQGRVQCKKITLFYFFVLNNIS